MANLSKTQITVLVEKSYGYLVDSDGLRDQRNAISSDTEDGRKQRAALSGEAHTLIAQADGICTATTLIGCYNEYNNELQEKLGRYETQRHSK